MSLVFNMKSLMWDTEPPLFGTPRQSSNFLLFGEEWHLEVEFDSIYNNAVYFVRGYEDVNVECRVCLCSRNGKATVKTPFSATCQIVANGLAIVSSEQYTVWNPGDLIFKSRLKNNDYIRFCKSERWKVYCHFSCDVQPVPLRTIHLSTGSSSSNPGGQTCPGIPPDLQRLSHDFSRMLEKEIMPDATVTCGGRTWKVHRSILIARSEVFAAMFLSGMTESETGAIRVEDLDPTVLDSLLKYVYSGKVPKVSCKNVSGLYEASDRYALHGLRELLSGWMVEHLSHKNCLGFLIVADAHSDAELKEASVAFITNNFSLIEKAVWTDFRKEHLQLAVEVLEYFAPVMKK